MNIAALAVACDTACKSPPLRAAPCISALPVASKASGNMRNR